jgi:hypothetical protein
MVVTIGDSIAEAHANVGEISANTREVLHG